MQQTKEEYHPKVGFRIEYDAKTDRFRIYPENPAVNLDGLAVHMGRGYSSKAIVDIVIRHSEQRPVYERTWEDITAFVGQQNVFRVARMESRGRFQLEQAVEREIARRTYRAREARQETADSYKAQ